MTTPTPLPADTFQTCLAHVLHLEGGWYPGTLAGDPNPTMHGVTQRVYDAYRDALTRERRTVRLIAPDEVSALYRQHYWTPMGCGSRSWPYALLVFDASVNHGLRRAHRLDAAALDDPVLFLALREAFYRQIATGTRAKFLKGWLNRITYLRHIVQGAQKGVP